MDELQAVGDLELRDALAFTLGRPRPVTADELAAHQDVHRNVARNRLERLVEAGLLEPGFERRTGRSGPGAGRPAKTYRVAPLLAAIEFPRRQLERLLGLVVDALPARSRQASLHDVGAAFGRELAATVRIKPERSLERGAEAVCRAVRRLGFQASVEAADDDRAVIVTPTCPLRPLVLERPDVAELDRGLWAGLAEAAVPGGAGSLRCETHDCLAHHADCRVTIERISKN